MKSSKCFNFDEILYYAQIEDGEFNTDNSFFVIFDEEREMFQLWWNFYFAQTEGRQFNGDNSFLRFLMPVNIDNCRYWYLLSFRPQFSTKNGKCSSFGESLYFTQHESGEFNDFDIERCNWVPQRIKTWNRETNLV